MAEDYGQRLTKVETQIDEHQRLLNAQSEKNETLTRLTILMERQQEESKDFKVSLNKFNDTLDKVNDNLTNLNNNQQKLNENQHQLGERVDNIESTLQEQKIDPAKLVKSILSYIATGLGSIGIAVAIWYLTK